MVVVVVVAVAVAVVEPTDFAPSHITSGVFRTAGYTALSAVPMQIAKLSGGVKKLV